MSELKASIPMPVWLSANELHVISRGLNRLDAGRGWHRDKNLERLRRKISKTIRRRTR